ncbi:MAG: ankyrin repeat domain-containing protein [Epsilonproteobacteria bacterium]|nr:ankyrin repeat domain-containing protein [Campylobacterota bacterium]
MSISLRFFGCVVLVVLASGLQAGEGKKEKYYRLHNTIRYRPEMLSEILEEIKLCDDLDELDYDGVAPLHIAAGKGETGIMEMLLDAGAGVAVLDKRDWSAMIHAVIGRSAPAVEFLVQHGFDVNMQCGEYGKTALHYAARWGEGITKAVIDAGGCCLDIDLQDYDGMTALHHAMDSYNFLGAQHLLDAGADQTIKDKRGRTPLDISVYWGGIGQQQEQEKIDREREREKLEREREE